MPPKVTKERRRIGRPPAGADGEKVKDYPQLSIRLPEGVKATLHALSVISSRPQWRLITDAIDCYLKARPQAEQDLVGDLIGRTKGRTPGDGRAAGSTRRRETARTPPRRGGK